jgi:hypothetical protein
MAEQGVLVLDLPSPPSGTIVVNRRCTVRIEEDLRCVVVAGVPVHHYSANDPVASAYARVLLADSGHATQREVAAAFECSERTVRRQQRRYADGGMTALAARSGWRPGRRRLPSKRARVIERLKGKGQSNREIAHRLGVTENAIRKQIGPSAPCAEQRWLPLDGPSAGTALPTATAAPVTAALPAQEQAPPQAVESSPEQVTPSALSLDVDPSNRIWDRLLAALGLLDDAAPLFSDGDAVPGAGVLCALPFLVASGIFRVAHKLYGEIGPAFYGTRTTILSLLLMALARIQRPEALKEHDPRLLGRLLGLDRAPEVKTVRRKLTRLASLHKAEQFGHELARVRVEQRGQLMGFLYVDGHVRAYHGQHDIPKTHVARVRLAMPATTDYWVNDQSGDPLFVTTASANAGLSKMLPDILREVRGLVGERRVTVVFDRAAWSPELFRELIDDGFDILTYRKGRCRKINERRFVLRSAQIDGRTVEYRLHSQPVRFLKGQLRLRQVTRLSDDGHQTEVLTSRWDLSDLEIAHRMFQRWRQENFFKYLREEYLLDALVDYQVEPDDPTRTVRNPRRLALDKQIQLVRQEVAKLEQAYGAAAVDNAEQRRPTMRGFKIAHGKIGAELRAQRERLAQLRTERRALPRRVEVKDVSPGAVVKLATERKHLTDLIKMVAYQAESDLLMALAPHYARCDQEGRTLLHELFRAAADISVANRELRITVGPLSSPHRTQAVAALCSLLNAAPTPFPGSTLTLRFAVHAPRQTGPAFPGPRAPTGRQQPKPDNSCRG